MPKQSQQQSFTVGFIGGGNMAKSIIGGLLPEVLNSKSIRVYDPNFAQVDLLQKEFGINKSADNHELIRSSDVVILAVKPQIMPKLLTEIGKDIIDNQVLVVSIAAGITQVTIQKNILANTDITIAESELAIIRVMPNTPALIKCGASGMFANKHVKPEQQYIAETLMNSVGTAFWVENESDIDTVTALSGSGPAYFMRFIGALIDSAVQAGLPEDVAEQLAIQTCIGSAKLIQMSDVSIQQLIKNVTSPGGTTEKALESFNHDKLEAIIQNAFHAALSRSKELGE